MVEEPANGIWKKKRNIVLAQLDHECNGVSVFLITFPCCSASLPHEIPMQFSVAIIVGELRKDRKNRKIVWADGPIAKEVGHFPVSWKLLYDYLSWLLHTTIMSRWFRSTIYD